MEALAGMASREETARTPGFCPRPMEVPFSRLRVDRRGRVRPGTECADPSAAEWFPPGTTRSGPELGAEVQRVQ